IGMKPGEKLNEQLYDGSAESAKETKHPSIIQITPHVSEERTACDLLNWVDEILTHGLPSGQRAIDALRWGLTETEKYAVSVSGNHSPTLCKKRTDQTALKIRAVYF